MDLRASPFTVHLCDNCTAIEENAEQKRVWYEELIRRNISLCQNLQDVQQKYEQAVMEQNQLITNYYRDQKIIFDYHVQFKGQEQLKRGDVSHSQIDTLLSQQKSQYNQIISSIITQKDAIVHKQNQTLSEMTRQTQEINNFFNMAQSHVITLQHEKTKEKDFFKKQIEEFQETIKDEVNLKVQDITSMLESKYRDRILYLEGQLKCRDETVLSLNNQKKQYADLLNAKKDEIKKMSETHKEKMLELADITNQMSNMYETDMLRKRLEVEGYRTEVNITKKKILKLTQKLKKEGRREAKKNARKEEQRGKKKEA